MATRLVMGHAVNRMPSYVGWPESVGWIRMLGISSQSLCLDVAILSSSQSPGLRLRKVRGEELTVRQ